MVEDTPPGDVKYITGWKQTPPVKEDPMKIPYWLTPSKINAEGHCIARVYSHGNVRYEKIIKRMVDCGSTLTATDIRATLDLFGEVVADELLKGNTVATPFANYHSSIKGLFRDQQDYFDPKRHKVAVHCRVGKHLRDRFAQKAKVKKERPRSKDPILLGLHDIASDTQSSVLTANGVAALRGKDLKFDPDDDEQGLFLLEKGGAAHRVGRYVRQRPSEILFVVPELEAGLKVRLEMRGSRYASGKMKVWLPVAPAGNSLGTLS